MRIFITQGFYLDGHYDESSRFAVTCEPTTTIDQLLEMVERLPLDPEMRSRMQWLYLRDDERGELDGSATIAALGLRDDACLRLMCSIR